MLRFPTLRSILRPAGAVLLCGALGAPGLAQGFNNQWLSYTNQTQTRLNVAPGLGATDPQEKDYAWGDLDEDGWVDLVVVRKQPVSTPGKYPNVLLMNEGGVLPDRTQDFARDSDVPDDTGFLVPTNDRDVVMTDVNLDGWLDVVTATTYSNGSPKHISHPRVYINKGNSPQGNWLGLRFENGRIPQFTTSGGTPTTPDFCGISAGDVDLDGAPDLYFTHYTGGSQGGADINDKLLMNDGNGFFTDESNLRVNSSMLNSSFGTSNYTVDLNMDGLNDVIKSENGVGDGVFSNPSQVGFLDTFDNIQGGSPYHVGVGDLNNDGRPDSVWSDDGLDRYRYNTGTDQFGRPIWGANKTFQFLAGGDDGFASNSLVTDLDNDGWKDVLIADVDVDIGGCSRRLHIYHNPGGAPGDQITLREEREQAGGNGWLGAVGLHQNDLTGTHDIAVFDIDNDGDKDLVIGRCAGTAVWMNDATPTCQADLGFGGPGNSRLQICGDVLDTSGVATIYLSNVPETATVLMGLSLTSNPTFINGLGGTIVPWVPDVLFTVTSTYLGDWESGPIQGGSGPASVYVQAVILDPAQLFGFGISNAVRMDVMP